jgi:hypothetical protein
LIILLQIQRHSMARSFRMWSECVFRYSFAHDCLPATQLMPFTSSFSARERNAVWLLEKVRKVNTKIFAGAVPEALWNESAEVGISSGAAVAEAVHNAWDIAARVPKHLHFRGQGFHSSASTSIGTNGQQSIASNDSAARGVSFIEKSTHRDLGEGMERLRLCVSLLQKQVHVSGTHCSSFMHFFVTTFSQMVQKVSVQRVRLPTVKFLLNSQG